MDGQQHLVLVMHDEEPAEQLRRGLGEDVGAEVQVFGRRGLEGSIAEWTLLVAASAQGIVSILDWVLKWRDRKTVRRIKFGDFEIENPTDEELAAFRRRLADLDGEH